MLHGRDAILNSAFLRMGDLYLGLDLSTQVVFFWLMHSIIAIMHFKTFEWLRQTSKIRNLFRNKSRKPWKQLKSVLIDSNHILVHSESVLFDDLGFNTTDGFINEGDGVITAPTIMFVAAIDKLFGKIDSELIKRVRSGGFSWFWLGRTLRAPIGSAPSWKSIQVSASGQQHGTVYWKNGAREILKNLDPAKSLQVGILEPPL